MSQELNCIAVSKSFTLEAKSDETEESSSSVKVKRNHAELEAGDWANIPPDVLFVDKTSPKKSRKSVISL